MLVMLVTAVMARVVILIKLLLVPAGLEGDHQVMVEVEDVVVVIFRLLVWKLVSISL